VIEKTDRRTGKQGQHDPREDIDTDIRCRKRTGVDVRSLPRINY
jgi:hypothetical protein